MTKNIFKLDGNYTTRPVVLFDGVCNLCNKTVQFILRNDKHQVFRFSSLQSDFARLLLADSGLSRLFIDSVILIEEGRLYTHSNAIIRIAVKLGGVYKLAAVLRIIPESLRDALYNYVASHRYRWFGKTESCMVPEPGISDRFLP